MSKRIRFRKTRFRELRLQVYERDNYTCVLCGWRPNTIPKDYDGSFTIIDGDRMLTMDHIIPLSKGGTNKKKNFQTTCVVCNNIKDDKIITDNDYYINRLIQDAMQ